jgi:hypothetical protein
MRVLIIKLICLVFPCLLSAQTKTVTVSGKLRDSQTKVALTYANILLKTQKDSVFIAGTISDEAGLFSMPNLSGGAYILEVSLVGYETFKKPILIGQLSAFLDVGTLELSENTTLKEVLIAAKQAEISNKLDKKNYSVADNISQSGGSVLQAMSNLPSVTVSQDGKIELRGSDKVAVLIDGKQTALTGFGSQKGLENIPASAIERIEIINNPSAKYDANGNAGIINIIFKKNNQAVFTWTLV